MVLQLADELRTGVETAPMGDDPRTWQLRAETWDDPRVVIGGNDGVNYDHADWADAKFS